MNWILSSGPVPSISRVNGNIQQEVINTVEGRVNRRMNNAQSNTTLVERSRSQPATCRLRSRFFFV